jgi:hypothetical protein
MIKIMVITAVLTAIFCGVWLSFANGLQREVNAMSKPSAELTAIYAELEHNGK